MPAGRHDIVIERGSTYRQTFQYLDADENAIDLTGWSARMQMRSPDWQGDVVPGFDLSSDVSPGGITITVATGEVMVEVSAIDTAAIDSDVCRGVYDLELEDPDGFVVRLIEGRIAIVPEVTR
jgi:hypothetical protein